MPVKKAAALRQPATYLLEELLLGSNVAQIVSAQVQALEGPISI